MTETTDLKPEMTPEKKAFPLSFLAGVVVVAGAALFLIIKKPDFGGGSSGGAAVVVLDSPKLVHAAVATPMLDAEQAIDSVKLGKLVAATVAEYQAKGFVVLPAGNAIAYPPEADITPIVAAKAGIDLGKAAAGEKLFSGEVDEAPATE